MRSVLITGGTGSFGKTMLRSLLEAGDAEEIRVFSRDEEKQHTLRTQLQDPRVKFFIGDVRDRASIDHAMVGVDCVFHAAAMKQVPSCEFFPMEAVRTNVHGSENVVRSGIANQVTSIVCLSTDKAVFPVNAMGMSKAMMEKVVHAAAREIDVDAPTTISCVRYGNVMYSRGSVIPLFVEQLKSGQALTVTEPNMTRFLMPLRDSVALVRYAFDNAKQGDLFVKKAVATSMATLVDAIKEVFSRPDHPVKVIGWRHGEKLFETLANAQELNKSEDLGEYFRIVPDNRDLNYGAYYVEGDRTTVAYEDFHSHNTEQMGVQETADLLRALPEIQSELESWDVTPV